MLPAISPAASNPPAIGDEEGANGESGDVQQDKGDEDQDELDEMYRVLETGGLGEGSNLSDAVIVGGQSEDDTPTAQAPERLRGPVNPSTEEIDMHNLTHLPYRSWCPHCVATKKPNIKHSTSRTESTIPLLVADYCYLRRLS